MFDVKYSQLILCTILTSHISATIQALAAMCIIQSPTTHTRNNINDIDDLYHNTLLLTSK